MNVAPESIVAKADFRNKTVDMRIPFKITVKSMENHNKTRGKVFGLIGFKEHAGDNTVDSVKKAIQ